MRFPGSRTGLVSHGCLKERPPGHVSNPDSARRWTAGSMLSPRVLTNTVEGLDWCYTGVS